MSTAPVPPAGEGPARPPAPLMAQVGNTPLVELTRMSPKPGVRLFAKLEGCNPSGSIKDRIARAIIEQAEAQGRIRPGDTLVEASTGNTAIALSMVARQKGYDLKVVVPEGVVPSIGDILDLYGIDVIQTKPDVGLKGAIELALQLADQHGWFATRQFDNPLNVTTHIHTTGAEIVSQIDQVDAFVAGLGTGGTMVGVGRALREAFPDVRLVGVEPRLGDFLQGIRSMDDQFRPPLIDLDLLSARYLVRSSDALKMMRRVVQEEGVFVGVSGGATLHAAFRYAERLASGNIVVMFSDGGWKYLPARPWEAALAEHPSLDDVHWW